FLRSPSILWGAEEVMDDNDNRQLAEMRREHFQLALARLVIVGMFILLWTALWIARIPYPLPFLYVLSAEFFVFAVYARLVFVLRTARQIRAAYVTLLSGEIVLLAMIVYFLGGASWLGGYACIYGVIFTSAFLDLRRGLIYAAGISAAFVSLSLLEAFGV